MCALTLDSLSLSLSLSHTHTGMDDKEFIPRPLKPSSLIHRSFLLLFSLSVLSPLAAQS